MKKASDVDRGWAWLVLVAVYTGAIIIYTTAYLGGVMYVALLQHFDAGETKTSLVGALNHGLLNLLGPVASVVMVTFSCRVSMFVGGTVLTISYFVCAFVDSIDVMIVMFGIFGGIGNCLSGTTFVVVIGYYFQKRRKLAVSMIACLGGLSLFIASPLAFALLKEFGLSGTFLILAGLNAQICVVAMICKPSTIEKNLKMTKHITIEYDKAEQSCDKTRCCDKTIVPYSSETVQVQMIYPRPNHLLLYSDNENELYTEQNNSQHLPAYKSQTYDNITKINGEGRYFLSENDDALCNGSVTSKVNSKHRDVYESDASYMKESDCRINCVQWLLNIARAFFNPHLLHNVRFMLFLVSTSAYNFALGICCMHLPNYVIIQGASETEVTAIMTCFSLSNLTGRILGATTVEKGGVDSLTLHVGILGVSGLAMSLFPFYRGPVGDYVFATIVGLYTGTLVSLMTPITIQMVKLKHLSPAHGLEVFFCGIGFTVGPPVAGFLCSRTGSYDSGFVLSGLVTILGSILVIFSSITKTSTEKTISEE